MILIVSADATAAHQSVINVMDAARRAGLARSSRSRPSRAPARSARHDAELRAVAGLAALAVHTRGCCAPGSRPMASRVDGTAAACRGCSRRSLSVRRRWCFDRGLIAASRVPVRASSSSATSSSAAPARHRRCMAIVAMLRTAQGLDDPVSSRAATGVAMSATPSLEVDANRCADTPRWWATSRSCSRRRSGAPVAVGQGRVSPRCRPRTACRRITPTSTSSSATTACSISGPASGSSKSCCSTSAVHRQWPPVAGRADARDALPAGARGLPHLRWVRPELVL